MLNYEFPPIGGGAGKAHHQLLKQYANTRNLAIDVLTCAPGPGFRVENFAQNIKIYKVGLHKKHLHYWRKIEVIEWLTKASFLYRKLLKTNNYKLAHAFFGFPTGLLCYLNTSKLPYIISLRGSDVPGVNPRLARDYKILTPLFKCIWQNARNIVACSEGLRHRALKLCPQLPITVIPNGVDTEAFHPRRIKSQKLRLLTVGRLSPTKRIDCIISAVAALTFSHHVSGCCSAQPLFSAMISSSFFGQVADAVTTWVCESIKVALIDEVPMSYPSKYIVIILLKTG